MVILWIQSEYTIERHASICICDGPICGDSIHSFKKIGSQTLTLTWASEFAQKIVHSHLTYFNTTIRVNSFKILVFFAWKADFRGAETDKDTETERLRFPIHQVVHSSNSYNQTCKYLQSQTRAKGSNHLEHHLLLSQGHKQGI